MSGGRTGVVFSRGWDQDVRARPPRPPSRTKRSEEGPRALGEGEDSGRSPSHQRHRHHHKARRRDAVTASARCTGICVGGPALHQYTFCFGFFTSFRKHRDGGTGGLPKPHPASPTCSSRHSTHNRLTRKTTTDRRKSEGGAMGPAAREKRGISGRDEHPSPPVFGVSTDPGVGARVELQRPGEALKGAPPNSLRGLETRERLGHRQAGRRAASPRAPGPPPTAATDGGRRYRGGAGQLA